MPAMRRFSNEHIRRNIKLAGKQHGNINPEQNHCLLVVQLIILDKIFQIGVIFSSEWCWKCVRKLELNGCHRSISRKISVLLTAHINSFQERMLCSNQNIYILIVIVVFASNGMFHLRVNVWRKTIMLCYLLPKMRMNGTRATADQWVVECAWHSHRNEKLYSDEQ